MSASHGTAFGVGDRIGGRFLVHNVFAGGMGEVYLCLDEQSRIPCALKRPRFRPEDGLDRIEALGDEVRVWMSLGAHPNVVECLGLERFGAHHFIRLEWVLGPSGARPDLRALLARRGRLDPRAAAGYAVDVARGLCHAQRRLPGVVHRDLKPENVLLGADGRAKITDFGLAVSRDVAVRAPQAVAGGGTYLYMAPEQWLGAPLDPRTDVYAVGCVLFELLSGRSPFAAPGILLGELRERHLTAAPVLDALPEQFRALVGTCLNKRPDDRFAGPDALLAALEEVHLRAFGEPPHAAPPEKDMYVGFYGARAMALADLRLYDEALAAVGQAIAKRPDDHTFRLLRGVIMFRAGRGAQAAEALAAIDERKLGGAVERGMYAMLLADLGRLEEAERIVTALFEENGPDGALLEVRAAVRSRAGRFDEAIADFRRVLDFGGSAAGAEVNASDLYLRSGRPREALAAARRATELDPTVALGWLNRGLAEAALGDAAASVESFRQGIRLTPGEVRLHYNLGVSLLHQKRYADAVAALSDALRINPEGTAALGNRGAALCELGQEDAALADWDRAIELIRSGTVQTIDLAQSRGSVNTGLYCNRGGVYFRRGDYARARADFLSALQEDERYADARMKLGYLCLLEGNAAEAGGHFRAAHRLGDERALAELTRLGIAPDPGEGPRGGFDPDLVRAGQEFIGIGTRDEMRQFVERHGARVRTPFWSEILQVLIHKSPDDRRERARQLVEWFLEFVSEMRPPAPEYDRLIAEGDAAFKRGAMGPALRAYERAVARAPDRPRGHGSCGLALQRLDENERAVEALGRALALAPTDLVARRGRAQSLFSLGRYEQAVADCDAALRARADDVDVRYLRARSLVALDRLAEAAPDYEVVCAARPDGLRTRLEFCDLLGRLGRVEEALIRAREAVRLEPDGHHAYLKGLELLVGAGRHERALEWIGEACAARPRNAVVRATRGSLLLTLDRRAEARADFDDALRLDPYQPVAHFHLAQLAMWADDRETALDHFERAAASGEEAFERARRQFREQMVQEDAPPPSLFVLGRDAFLRARTADDLHALVREFPFALNSFFQDNLVKALARMVTEGEIDAVGARFRALRELAREVGEETVPPGAAPAGARTEPAPEAPTASPERASAALGAARAAEAAGDLPAAAAHAAEAVRLDPGSRDAVLLLSRLLARTVPPAEAVQVLTRFVAARPQPDPEALEARGILHLEAASYTLGVADLLPVVETPDASGRACYSLGMCYLMLEQYADALPPFDRAVEKGFKVGDAHLNRSACFAQLGQVEESLAAARASAAENPADHRALANVGVLLFERGRLADALPALDAAAARGDPMSRARAAAAREALRLGRDRADDPVQAALGAVATAKSFDDVRELCARHPFLLTQAAVLHLRRVNQAGLNRHGAPLIPRPLAWLEQLCAERDRARERLAERVTRLQQDAVAAFRGGDAERARALLEEAWGLLDPDEEPAAVVNVGANLAYVCSEAGHAERCLELVGTVLDRIDAVPVKEELTLVELLRASQSALSPALEGAARPVFARLAPLLAREGPKPHAAAAYRTLARLCERAGQYAAAEPAREEAARLSGELGEWHDAFNALHEGSVYHLQAGAIDSAERLSARSLALARARHDAIQTSAALYQRSHVLDALGDRPGAVEAVSAAVEQAGSEPSQVLALAVGRRGMFRQAAGDFEGAYEDFRRELACAGDAADANHVALLARLGEVCERTGRYEEAIGYRTRELGVYEGRGDTPGQAPRLHVLGRLYLFTRQYEQAVEAYERALPIDRAGNNPFVEGLTRGFLGDACFRLRRFAAADGHYAEALRLLELAGYPDAVATTLDKLAASARVGGRSAEALAWSRRGLEHSRRHGLRTREARFHADAVATGTAEEMQAYVTRVLEAIADLRAADTLEALARCVEEQYVWLYSSTSREWFEQVLARPDLEDRTRRHVAFCGRLLDLCREHGFQGAVERLRQEG